MTTSSPVQRKPNPPRRSAPILPGALDSLPLPPGYIRSILFTYGAAQFFVDPEPGLVDFMFPLLLLFMRQKAILHPVFVLLLGSNIFAIVLELFIFRTVQWSVLSLYLTLAAAALYSLLTRYDFKSSLRTFLLGGAVGAGLTLAVLLTPYADSAYRFGFRFTGFFKDPNVAAPTALFFTFMLLGLPRRWRWIAIIPAAVFILPLSRATFLAAGIAVVYILLSRSVAAALIGGFTLIIGLIFSESILALVNRFFSSVGRGGITNDYDSDRSENWLQLTTQFLRSGVPLGPGYSENNGYSVHSTYLRLLVEQGPVSLLLFIAAIVLCWKASTSILGSGALVALVVNGIVLDATHWRILFVAMAVTLASATMKTDRFSAAKRVMTTRQAVSRRSGPSEQSV